MLGCGYHINVCGEMTKTASREKQPFLLNVLVWLHVPDKLRPSGAMGCLAESHRQAQVVNGSIMPLVVGLKWEQPMKERKSWYHKEQ